MLEIFKLPALAAAQLRFYQEVVEANETYDFHQSVIKFAIQWHQRAKANVLDPSAWWPVIPQWRDSFLRQPKPAKARLADTRRPLRRPPAETYPNLLQPLEAGRMSLPQLRTTPRPSRVC